MDRKLVLLLTFSVISLIGVFLTTGLQEKAYDVQMDRLDSAVLQAEKEMGIYDEKLASTTPAIKRAIQLSREMKKQAEANQQLLDSLARTDQEALGVEAEPDTDTETTAYSSEDQSDY